eukprot:TRINITY_DN75_c0_g1_i5.p1 TRINITY_DN75_c0_g1~~TRINITY_DN75_c0_g1_i5.p1  ORF type:complete len:142 (-),score=28.16 TRINITY_DN75_c0_g1_i5:62-487(-)
MKGIILISIVVFALLISVSAKKGKSSSTKSSSTKSSSTVLARPSAPTAYAYDESRLFYDGYGYGAMDQYIQTVYKYYGVGHGYNGGGSQGGRDGYGDGSYGSSNGYNGGGSQGGRGGYGGGSGSGGRQGGSGYGRGYPYSH